MQLSPISSSYHHTYSDTPRRPLPSQLPTVQPSPRHTYKTLTPIKATHELPLSNQHAIAQYLQNQGAETKVSSLIIGVDVYV